MSDREAANREVYDGLVATGPVTRDRLLAELAAAREERDAEMDTREALEAELTAALERETKLRLELDETGECVRLCTPEAQAEVAKLREALQAEIERVCECGGEDVGNGPGVGAIDSERSQFDYGAGAYDGAGHVITDYFDCPCVPLRAALADGEGEA